MSARSSQRRMPLLVIWFTISAVFLDYATCQSSCSASNNRPGVCVPMLECDFIKQLLQISPRPLPAIFAQYLRNTHCGTINNQHYACCDVNQYSGTTARWEGTIARSEGTTPKPPPVQPPPENRRRPVVEVDAERHSEELPSPGMSMLQEQICGTIESDRVANGVSAKLSEYPWMALLVYDDGITKTLGCGGSLITEQHVLTAAHCIRVASAKRLVAVRLGEHDTGRSIDCSIAQRKCAPPVQEIDIAEAIQHKDYNSGTLSDDIGLLRLQTKAVISSSVIPICLPITESSKTLPNRFVIAGWGYAENGQRAAVLQKAAVDIVGNDRCQSIYSRIPITDKQVCAGGENEVQTCMGDSGGPLMYPTRYRRGSRMVQYGVVSGGSKTCGSNFPDIFTMVEPYLQWITSKIAT